MKKISFLFLFILGILQESHYVQGKNSYASDEEGEWGSFLAEEEMANENPFNENIATNHTEQEVPLFDDVEDSEMEIVETHDPKHDIFLNLLSKKDQEKEINSNISKKGRVLISLLNPSLKNTLIQLFLDIDQPHLVNLLSENFVNVQALKDRFSTSGLLDNMKYLEIVENYNLQGINENDEIINKMNKIKNKYYNAYERKKFIDCKNGLLILSLVEKDPVYGDSFETLEERTILAQKMKEKCQEALNDEKYAENKKDIEAKIKFLNIKIDLLKTNQEQYEDYNKKCYIHTFQNICDEKIQKLQKSQKNIERAEQHIDIITAIKNNDENFLKNLFSQEETSDFNHLETQEIVDMEIRTIQEEAARRMEQEKEEKKLRLHNFSNDNFLFMGFLLAIELELQKEYGSNTNDIIFSVFYNDFFQ